MWDYLGRFFVFILGFIYFVIYVGFFSVVCFYVLREFFLYGVDTVIYGVGEGV